MKTLALAVALSMTALPALATNYIEGVPAMGPALMPGPSIPGPAQLPGIVAMQIVDKAGPVDWVTRYYGQNWWCTGWPAGDPHYPAGDVDQGNENDSAFYPILGLYDVGYQNQDLNPGSSTYQFIDESIQQGLYPELAVLFVGHPLDYPNCTAESTCHNGFIEQQPVLQLNQMVRAGDVLVWTIDRNGRNCEGGAYANHLVTYPSAPGGMTRLGIHVQD